jgi:hypothetical protein
MGLERGQGLVYRIFCRFGLACLGRTGATPASFVLLVSTVRREQKPTLRGHGHGPGEGRGVESAEAEVDMESYIAVDSLGWNWDHTGCLFLVFRECEHE